MKRCLHTFLLSFVVLVSSCTATPEHTVCFFGSSVCKGVGADSLQGYADLVGQRLPHGWQAVNVSVSGNDTYDLFARYDRDLTPTSAKYVVVGLSLGNEGLHEKGERALLSYRENMPRLIEQLQRDGRIVIVTNNYPRADFNAVDYNDLCEVNLEVQQWNVTTVNLFGTIDDGHGHWAYWNGTDIYHPDNRGHQAFASAFPPSLWQALDKGKPLPEYIATMDDQSGIEYLTFVPEEGVESYTLSYQSGDTTYTTVYSDCQHVLKQYINGVCICTTADYTSTAGSYSIRGHNLHQLLFYRAALTEREVHALVEGKLLRSSLELYCPLLGGNTDNLAQTTNKIQLINNYINN